MSWSSASDRLGRPDRGAGQGTGPGRPRRPRPVPESARGRIHEAGNDGCITLAADTSRGVLAGATSAGPAGGEVLSMLVLAVHAAVPVQRLREMICAYPAFHLAVESALDDLAGRDGPYS